MSSKNLDRNRAGLRWDAKTLVKSLRHLGLGFALCIVALNCLEPINEVHAAAGSTASTYPSPEKVQYKYCGEDHGCTFPGRGYTVCEALLRMLNLLGADAAPVTCEISTHLQFPQFRRPQWLELDVQEHLKVVYRLDLATSPHNNEGRMRRALDFDQWKARFTEEISSGKIEPRLLKTELRLPWVTTTVLGYDRKLCRRHCNTESRELMGTGLYLFSADEATAAAGDAGRRMIGYGGKYDILDVSGTYYFVRSSFSRLEGVIEPTPNMPWAADEQIRVYKAIEPAPGEYRERIAVALLDRCQFVTTWPRKNLEETGQ
jgi:hypothetical protein